MIDEEDMGKASKRDLMIGVGLLIIGLLWSYLAYFSSSDKYIDYFWSQPYLAGNILLTMLLLPICLVLIGLLFIYGNLPSQKK